MSLPKRTRTPISLNAHMCKMILGLMLGPVGLLIPESLCSRGYGFIQAAIVLLKSRKISLPLNFI